MPVGAVYRVAVNSRLYDQLIVNVLHYQQSTANGTADSDMKKLADAYEATVKESLRSVTIMGFSQKLLEVRTMPIPPVALEGYDRVLADGEGLLDENGIPPSGCVVVRKRTAKLGLAYRGRMYVAGVSQEQVSAGQLLETPYTDLWLPFAGVLKNAIVDVASGSPTFSPVLSKLVPIEGGGFELLTTPIISCDVDPVIRSQRRREVGVGE